MAKTFNNGQTFGEIRKILNDNADEINTNKTAAERLASSEQQGQVKSRREYNAANPNVNQYGNILFSNGYGYGIFQTLVQGFDFEKISASTAISGSLWYMDGKRYEHAWKVGVIRAFAFIAAGYAVAFDLDTNEVWIRGVGGLWIRISGGGGDGGGDASELQTTPLAKDAEFPPFPTAGVKVYTFAHPIQGMPSKLEESGFDYSGVLTVYPGGFATLLVSGIPEDEDEQDGSPYLSPNGLWTLAQGWHKAYEVSFPVVPLPEPLPTQSGKEEKDKNGE